MLVLSEDYKATGKKNYNVRVNAKATAKLLRGEGRIPGVPPATKKKALAGAPINIVAGSKPPASGAIWAHWESTAFKVLFLLLTS